MEGWPEGWSCLEGVGSKRFVGPEGRYVLYGKRAGCRRAAWAIEGGAGAVDREALAKALLHAQHTAWGSPDAPWEGYKLAYRDSWLTVADEAIRLLVGSAKPAKALYDEIEELERRNAALTATANAALERAKEAEDWAEEMRTLHTSDLAAALEHTDGAHFGELVVIAGQRSAMLKERDQRIAALTATANAAVARAEETQLQARRAMEERNEQGETIALRAEVQRLRRALDRTAQGAAYLTDALSELTGGDHA